MTYFYDNYVAETYGMIEGKTNPQGTYITPNGLLCDVDGRAITSHAGGFVIPFFMKFIDPSEETIKNHTKKEMKKILKYHEKQLISKKLDVNPKEQQMRLYLVRYLKNVYKSKLAIWDSSAGYADFSEVTGIPKGTENLYGRDRRLKDILVQGCNFDSIESQIYRGITTSKFNIHETFYDYILHGFRIFIIPKKVYSKEKQKYVDYIQPEWMISDKERRLKEELETICKYFPLEEREQFCRGKEKIKRYDLIS